METRDAGPDEARAPAASQPPFHPVANLMSQVTSDGVKSAPLSTRSRARREKADFIGGVAAFVSLLLLTVAFVLGVVLAADVPGMIANGVPDPTIRQTIARDVFGGTVSNWPALMYRLMFVVAVVLIPAYLIAWPFRWFGAETLGLRVQNGMAVFTLFGWTMGMLLQMRDRRNEAKQTCESARRRSG